MSEPTLDELMDLQTAITTVVGKRFNNMSKAEMNALSQETIREYFRIQRKLRCSECGFVSHPDNPCVVAIGGTQ